MPVLSILFQLLSIADLGTVQRMPRAVANRSWFNEMMFTGWCFAIFFKNHEIHGNRLFICATDSLCLQADALIQRKLLPMACSAVFIRTLHQRYLIACN
jgi:hypothetical protein